MRILFDQGTPSPLRRHLVGHQVETAYERGWSRLTNGDLLASAEREGFEVLITTDRSLRYQQRLTGRRMSVVVLSTTSWPRIRASLDAVVRAVDEAGSTTFIEVTIP